MSNELEDIILTIDTREQNQIRIKAVEDWFTGHGAVVEHSALKHCDYRLIGEFRGISVNLGVEAKGWDNFLSDSIDEMEEKLLLATEEYEHVGFFVESQNYTFTPDENNSHGTLNYSIPRLNKKLPAKTLAAFEGMLDTISKHPQIHVRQLRGEAQFPYSLYDLLVYLQNPHVIKARKGVYKPYLLNLYMQIPEVGIVRAKKLIEHYPNPFWLCSASEESLKEVLGKKTGELVYGFLRNPELITDEWKAGRHLDGTVKYKTICGQDCYNPQHCNTLCERHPNNPKNLKQDDEGRLAFDAPAKNPVNTSGESIAIMAAIEGYLSGFPEGRTANEICEHFNIESGDPDKERLLKFIKQLAWDERITSEGRLFKIRSCDYADPKNRAACKTPDHFKQLHSSHPSGNSILRRNHTPNPSKLPDDDKPLGSPPIFPHTNQEVTQEGSELSPPAETDIGLGKKPLDMVVNCRACHQVIIPEQDDETGFCNRSECIAERDKPTYRMTLKEAIKDFMQDGKPHLLAEIVEHCKGWTPGNVFEHVMGAVKSGYFKKITDPNAKSYLFQKVEL